MGGYETAALAVLGAVQKQQRYRAQYAAIASGQQAEIRRLDLARQIRERDQRGRLASLQAAQRARFGAVGVGRGGSAEAVINGLAKETEQTIRDGLSRDQLRLRQSAEAVRQARKNNLFDFRGGQARDLSGVARRLSLLER